MWVDLSRGSSIGDASVDRLCGLFDPRKQISLNQAWSVCISTSNPRKRSEKLQNGGNLAGRSVIVCGMLGFILATCLLLPTRAGFKQNGRVQPGRQTDIV